MILNNLKQPLPEDVSSSEDEFDPKVTEETDKC
jgi:hypothetical protein